VVVKENQVIAEADDAAERRWRFVFEPYQAVRVTTADCFSTPGGLTLIPQAVVEVADSEWIAELKASLTRIDHTATFMDKAHHFLLPLQDDFLEVVAWAVRCEPVESSFDSPLQDQAS
jgi:hypothetical protein